MSAAALVRWRVLLLLTSLALALHAAEPPSIGVDERLGARVPGDLALIDQDGRATRLDALAGGKPLLLVPGYYRCPMLCGLVLKQVAEAMAGCDWTPGREYAVAAVSFDADDDRIAALRKRDAVAQSFASDPRLAHATDAWPFLVAHQPQIDALVAALGLRIAREGTEIAHPAVAIVLTPDGRIARYLHGIGWTARDLKLALSEAADGKIGSFTDHVLLRCWSWDPATRRYRFAVATVMRAGGACVLVLMALGFLWLRRGQRRRQEAPRQQQQQQQQGTPA